MLVTRPFASGRYEGSFGSTFVSELASSEVVDASCKVSTAALDVRRIDSRLGGGLTGLGLIGPGAGPGAGGGVGVGAIDPVTLIVCQL